MLAAGEQSLTSNMKRGIGLLVTTLVAASKKRGFCSPLATYGGGVHPCTQVTLEEVS